MVDKKQKKNIAGFKQLYDDFFQSLCLFANNYLHNENVSKDIVQDAFLYCWTKQIDIGTPVAVKSYLYKYVRNRSLNYLRDEHLVNESEFNLMRQEDYFRDSIIEEETYRIIYDAIKVLPPQGKYVIELTLDGFKNHEIADKMGISINTVKTTKRRAFCSLRSELKVNVFALLLIASNSEFSEA